MWSRRRRRRIGTDSGMQMGLGLGSSLEEEARRAAMDLWRQRSDSRCKRLETRSGVSATPAGEAIIKLMLRKH